MKERVIMNSGEAYGGVERDGRNGVEEIGREREVAGEEVEGADQSLRVVSSLLLLLLLLLCCSLLLQLRHGPWREGPSQRSPFFFLVKPIYLIFDI